jgi:hypothetical protein
METSVSRVVVFAFFIASFICILEANTMMGFVAPPMLNI